MTPKTILRDIIDGQHDLAHIPMFKALVSNRNSCCEIILEEIAMRGGIYDYLCYYPNKEFYPIVIDLGANIGLFSAFMAPMSETIYAVEPTPAHCEAMRDIHDSIGLTNVKINQLAISDENGPVEFNFNSSNTTMNSLAHRPHWEPVTEQLVTVEAKTLLSFIESNIPPDKNIDFLKMDIEGAEEQVIFHPEFKAALDRIDEIFIEVHVPLAELKKLEFQGHDFSEIIRPRVDRIAEKLHSLGLVRLRRIGTDGVLASR